MLRTIGGLDKIGASQSHLAQALQATSFPGLDTPYTPPTHFFYGLVKTWVDNVNSYPPIYVWNIWRPGAFDGGWLLRRPPAYWLRLQASGVRGRNGGGPLVLEEPDQGTVGPLGTADQANQRLLQAGLRPHCTADQSFQRWNPLQTILQGPPINRFSAEQKNITEGTQQEMWFRMVLEMSSEYPVYPNIIPSVLIIFG